MKNSSESIRAKGILVVDLDGTLLKSDMLHESFWFALGRSWRSLFLSVGALWNGKAALKDFLSSAADIDVSTLPYDKDVVAYVLAFRKQGGRVALVTASSQELAEKIAHYLEIFDEVHGSGGSCNLKGMNKAAFLVDRFGNDGFCYMGDAYADLPVWKVSNKIVTVNAPPDLRSRTEEMGKSFEHLATTSRTLRPYITALRPHQWLKNVLVFLPMIAAHQFDAVTLLSSILAFLAFSLVASSVYVFNDLLDLGSDRTHPRKRLRPFASGAISVSHGSILAFAILSGGIFVATFLGMLFLVAMVGYFLLTMAYSLALKRRIVIDIFVLAGLYAVRIIAGSFATGIELSVWLLAFSIFFFLSLAAVKRQAELVDAVSRGRLTAKGRGYHVEDLPIISMVGLAAGYLSVLVLALYVNSPAVQQLYSSPVPLWGICCVLLYWLTRMVLITHRGAMHDDPLVFAIEDRVSQICFVLILVFAALGASV